MKSWKSQKIPMHFSNLGRCETLQAVPRSQPAIPCNCSYGHSRYTSDILRSQNYFNRCMVFWGVYPPVFFVRGCAWMSAPENNTENHLVVLRELSWLPGNMSARFSARGRDFRASAREFRKCKVGAYPSVTIAVAETNAGNIVHTVGILIGRSVWFFLFSQTCTCVYILVINVHIVKHVCT